LYAGRVSKFCNIGKGVYLGAGNLLLHDLKVPEFHMLVCGAGDEGFAIGVNLQRPNGALVGLDSVNDRRGGDVKELDCA
jgi:hypothetical protein